jgi:hypothetical protein
MTDETPGLGRCAPSASAPTRQGYASAAQAVAIRAETSRYGQDNETRRAFARFAERLASGEPLRRDVPSGYHLSIVV